jgi:hypothetical protein
MQKESGHDRLIIDITLIIIILLDQKCKIIKQL